MSPPPAPTSPHLDDLMQWVSGEVPWASWLIWVVAIAAVFAGAGWIGQRMNRQITREKEARRGR